jgi:flagellar motility protein MotE (MotC chaperone)
MTSITFKNQYNTYVSTINKPAKANEVVATSGPVATAKTSDSEQTQIASTKPQEKSFLENAQEALIYQRLGVDKETIAELKAAIDALAEKLQEQGADIDTIKEQLAELQKMLEQEYEKGTDRMVMQPTHEKGKLVTALA